MARPTTIPEPWFSLAAKLGGAGELYAVMQARLGISERTARRICQGTGTLNFDQCVGILELFEDQGIPMEVKR